MKNPIAWSKWLGEARSHRHRAFVCAGLLTLLYIPFDAPGALPEEGLPATWPQGYAVQRDDHLGLLTLSTPYYIVQHDFKQGGAIAKIQLTHGRCSNLLAGPMQTVVRNEMGTAFADLNSSTPRVMHRHDGMTEVVTADCDLLDEHGRPAGIQLKTTFVYHWGYLKIRKELTLAAGTFQAREISPLVSALAPTLVNYGYRDGLTEQEGAPPFSFGSCRWGKLGQQSTAQSELKTAYVPRYLLLADPDVEGLEWFVGSDLSQWDLQLAGHRGQGQCLLQMAREPAAVLLSISPFRSATNAISLPNRLVFDYYLGLPLLEGHARMPWFHNSFNRNKGNWVSDEQVRQWAESGIQTVHCHNDGDYYDDGLFWRDGSYPPYPDMENYNRVITNCHRAGIKVATYFSNKELHPSTKEFQEHGSEWGRMNYKGALQHNFFRGKSEFGVQMCLRSGWLDFLKLSIDRVLTHHPLDGVYYDWNVALLCCNPLHEGKSLASVAVGHWDIDELLNLMEWTRRRVGTNGLIIVHNTTTPMFATENFADFVVANEWGYGKWSEKGADLEELPLEWSLVGARPRGVISYGQIDGAAPRRLHRLFALEALLGGASPWPASPEGFEVFSVLKPIGDLATFRFADWRNQAVLLQGGRCGCAIYSRPDESYLLLANLESGPREIQCTLRPEKLPYPLSSPSAATVVLQLSGGTKRPLAESVPRLDLRKLITEGIKIPVLGDSVSLLRIN